MTTYVVGHKNPDTDSIVSAIALSELEGYKPARSGDLNKETVFVLNTFKVSVPEPLPAGEKNVVLVDNNGNPDELADGIDVNKIISVYDHHKLGGLKTTEPITVWVEPVGSTATLISELYDLRDITPQPEIAGILLSGIISDTLNFTSPTTCDRDHLAAEKLNKIAKVNMDKLAKDMFASKSDISDVATENLITKDYKIFEMSGKKVGVGVWETIIPHTVLKRSEDIVRALEAERKEGGLDYIFFAVVDILQKTAYFIVPSGKEAIVVEAVFPGKVTGNTLVVEGVVSRKKQIVPPLEKYFSK